MIGAEALASESVHDLTNTRWGAVQLYGKWANIRNEVTPEEVRKVERFKELTGGDRISAEYKGQQKFEFDITQKFIFAMNQMPQVKGADSAFWNRLLFAEFPDTVPDEEKDAQLDTPIIEEEGAGVLNWMLDGLERLMEQRHFTAERSTDEKKELCNAFDGTFDRFIRDAVEITGDDSDAVVKSDLHQLAQTFADYLDMEPDWNRQSGFTRELKQQQGVGEMETRSLTSDSDKHDVYLVVCPHTHLIEELNVDVICGELYGDGDSDQSSLI